MTVDGGQEVRQLNCQGISNVPTSQTNAAGTPWLSHKSSTCSRSDSIGKEKRRRPALTRYIKRFVNSKRGKEEYSEGWEGIKRPLCTSN